MFCLLMMTTSNRKRQVICALTLSRSLLLSPSLAFGILSIPKKRYVEHANVSGQRQVRDAGASLTSFVVVAVVVVGR